MTLPNSITVWHVDYPVVSPEHWRLGSRPRARLSHLRVPRVLAVVVADAKCADAVALVGQVRGRRTRFWPHGINRRGRLHHAHGISRSHCVAQGLECDPGEDGQDGGQQADGPKVHGAHGMLYDPVGNARRAEAVDADAVVNQGKDEVEADGDNDGHPVQEGLKMKKFAVPDKIAANCERKTGQRFWVNRPYSSLPTPWSRWPGECCLRWGTRCIWPFQTPRCRHLSRRMRRRRRRKWRDSGRPRQPCWSRKSRVCTPGWGGPVCRGREGAPKGCLERLGRGRLKMMNEEMQKLIVDEYIILDCSSLPMATGGSDVNSRL